MHEPAVPLVAAHVAGTGPLPPPPHGTTLDALLAPTGSLQDPAYVQLGSLRVERSHFAEFETAQRHLARAPEGIAALYALEHLKEPVTLTFGADDQNGYSWNRATGGGRTIYWDPHSALLNANGTAVSPSLGLLHEEGHAIEHGRHSERIAADIALPSRRYTNAEEQRNITGLETRVARTLGEGTRPDHGGIPYPALGPAQTQPVPGAALSVEAAVPALNAHLEVQRILGYNPPPDASQGSTTAWDGKRHAGTVVHIDAHTVAQHVGRGEYQLYDVARDLHGHVPPENVPDLTIDVRGAVHVPTNARERFTEHGR